MGKIKKYKNSIERFLSGEKGQRFFNFAYSIGAAIVIWGALFKILHLPGGSTLLSIGMGTEVLMFILTAFDRPPREYHWEEVFPVLSTKSPEDRPDFQGGGNIIVGSGTTSAPYVSPSGAKGVNVPAGGAVIPPDATPTDEYVAQIAALSQQMDQLRHTTESLNNVSEVLLQSYRAITENSENITRSSTGYVEEMQALNRNIAGLNTIYEIQLKSVSSQLDSIDRVNRGIKDIRDMYEKSSAMSERYCEETEKMARYMQQLNQVYEKMLHAMTINMYNPMGAPAPQTPAGDTSIR
ncbi:gliding motility protein GldL [uncultured Muribaculum sp.]|uniref:type IX secretion system motor protein PorL/GldL n=1 Tax=uncultured Muribaculum sp. TaxID=1918613 RepID=UPI0025D3A369|nr:gliding motility protein GldL [uncultured Muribaculum sp.]